MTINGLQRAPTLAPRDNSIQTARGTKSASSISGLNRQESGLFPIRSTIALPALMMAQITLFSTLSCGIKPSGKPGSLRTVGAAGSATSNSEAAAASSNNSVSTSGCQVPAAGSAYALARPILDQACISCHNGATLPNMTTEADALTNKAKIADAVIQGRMPPSGPLASADVNVLKQWAAATTLALAPVAPTYEGSIKLLINSKCGLCHSATASSGNIHTPYLTSLDLVKSNADSILSHMNGSGEDKMPPKDALPLLVNSDIAEFQAWIDGNYQQGTPPVAIDPSQAVYYINTIKTVLDSNCIGCHKAGVTSPDLSTYQSASAAAARSLARIQAGTMPPSGPIAADMQTAFQSWLTADRPYDATGSIQPSAIQTTAPAASTGQTTSTATSGTVNPCP